MYSAGLGCSFPREEGSGSGKRLTSWKLQSPIACTLDWVIQIYNPPEALPNLVNLFWNAPLLGILKPRARDLAGYGMLQLVVQLSIVVLFVLAVFAVDPVRASYSMSCQHPG